MKKYKPTTPSRRRMTGLVYRDLLTSTKSDPFKKLTMGFKRDKGRSSGKITTRHNGGGSKRLYRKIDFKYDKKDIPAKIESVEYDPNRSAFVALVSYADGEKRYILAPQGVTLGNKFIVSDKAELKTGNRMPLKKILSGMHVHNIEIQPGSGAKLIRSAGNFAELLSHEGGYAHLKMPSREIRKIPSGCWATIGEASNIEHNLEVIGKAGRSRWLGKRPTVRGTAMNPVDHPYGGGEGRQSRGTKRPKTKWGKTTGGVRTRKPKKYSNKMIIKRRVKKKRK